MPLRPTNASFEALSKRHGPRYRWIVLIILALGMVSGVLATSSFNVAVPAMARHFGLGQDQIQWTMTGFMTAMTVAMLPASWLIDRLGFRRVFLLALAVLTAASIGGYFATSFALVVLARILQGAAAGVMQPMGVMALMRMFPPEQQGRASGMLTFGIVLAPAVAPALSGLLLDRFGWESIFLLGLPFGLVASVAAVSLLPAPRELKPRSFDWPGLGWLTLATVALIEAVSALQHSGLGSPWTLGQGAVSGLAALLFVRHSRRAAAPLITLGLFGQRTFAMGTIVAFCYGFGLYASTYLIPVFLQSALSYSAAAAGMALLPSGIALVLTLPIAGRMADHFPPKWVTLGGLVLLGLSFLPFAIEGGQIPYRDIILATVAGRIGLGLILPALNLATLRQLPSQQLGQATVLSSYARQLGGVMGVAIVAVFIQWRESAHGTTAPGIFTAYAQGFVLLSVVFALAVVAAWRMKSGRRGRS